MDFRYMNFKCLLYKYADSLCCPEFLSTLYQFPCQLSSVLLPFLNQPGLIQLLDLDVEDGCQWAPQG